MACETTSGNGSNTSYQVKRGTQVLQPKTIDYSLKPFYIAIVPEFTLRDLPERFGDFRVVHTRHSRWSEKGERIAGSRCFDSMSPTTNTPQRDSTIVRAHQHSAGAKKKHQMIHAKPKP